MVKMSYLLSECTNFLFHCRKLNRSKLLDQDFFSFFRKKIGQNRKLNINILRAGHKPHKKDSFSAQN